MADEPEWVTLTRTLQSTTDPVAWAREFCRFFAGYVVLGETVLALPEHWLDEGRVSGWFAHAIETGRSFGQGEECDEEVEPNARYVFRREDAILVTEGFVTFRVGDEVVVGG